MKRIALEADRLDYDVLLDATSLRDETFRSKLQIAQYLDQAGFEGYFNNLYGPYSLDPDLQQLYARNASTVNGRSVTLPFSGTDCLKLVMSITSKTAHMPGILGHPAIIPSSQRLDDARMQGPIHMLA